MMPTRTHDTVARRNGHAGHAEPGEYGIPEAVPLRRRWNLRWLLGGLVLVAASALVMAGFGPDRGPRVEALALARALKAGEVLVPGDLERVELRGGSRLSVVSPSQRDDLVGSVAPTDLPAGMLVAPDLFGAAPRIGAGQALAGVVVSEGALPLTQVSVGATVLVVETPSEGALAADGQPVVPSMWPATVHSLATVEDETGGVATFVSLRLSARAAPSVAAAAAQRRVRLVLVDSLDEVPGDLLYAERFPDAEPAAGDADNAEATP